MGRTYSGRGAGLQRLPRGLLTAKQHPRNLKKKKQHSRPPKQNKTKIPFSPYTPETGRERRPRQKSRAGSRFNPARHGSSGLPRRMEIGAAAAGSYPSPPKSAAPRLSYRACGRERGPGAPRSAAGRTAEPQLRRGSESPDKARDGEAERRLMASPTRRAPPAPLRPPACLGAAQRRSERSPVRAASAPPPPEPPRPRLAPPPPPGCSASPLPSHRSGGLHEFLKRKIKMLFFLFFFFFFFFSRVGVLRLWVFFAPSSNSPAEPPAGLGVGARGAGAGKRGLKASQALQRPTRACTPPPVPAEKSSSYPRLHRSAFLFQSAGRLAAPPFSGQARCLERAPLLRLLARLLAPLPGPARLREAGGGFARETAWFPLPLLHPLCLLSPASLLRLSNSPLSPLVCV